MQEENKKRCVFAANFVGAGLDRLFMILFIQSMIKQEYHVETNMHIQQTEKRIEFDLFKSNICHRLKEIGDIEFLINALESGIIRQYYDKQWYPEALYLLATLDYVSRVNEVELCADYDDLRSQKLKETIYPSSIIAQALITGDETIKDKAIEESIPEFIRFNIVERDIRDVV